MIIRKAMSIIRRILNVNYFVVLLFFGCLDGLEHVEEDVRTTRPGMEMRERMKQSILELDDGGDLIQNNSTR